MRHFLFLLLALGLGCAGRKGAVSLGAGPRLQLLPPAACGSARYARHHIRIQKGGRTFAFDALVEMDPSRFVLVGLTPVGSRMFSLVWDGEALVLEKLPLVSLPIAFGELALLYQLSFFPQGELQKSLPALAFEAQVRQWGAGEKPVVRIDYDGKDLWRAKVHVYNRRKGYELFVTTLESALIEDP